MIERINNYAITSGQPGIINEEAFTTLELVGKCGQKVNECIDQVNTDTDNVTTLQLQYDAVREIAQTGVRNADAAQTAANAAQATADNGLSRANTAFSIANVANTTASSAEETANAIMNNYTENLYGLFFLWFDSVVNNYGEYDLEFLEHVAQVMCDVLNSNNKFYNLDSPRPFGSNILHKSFDVSLYDIQNSFSEEGLFGYGKLRFTIFADMPGDTVRREEDGTNVVIWEYSQMVYGSPNMQIRGEFMTINAKGTFGIPKTIYSENHHYDAQTFEKITYGPYTYRLVDVI